jgi:hypothetical protein
MISLQVLDSAWVNRFVGRSNGGVNMRQTMAATPRELP